MHSGELDLTQQALLEINVDMTCLPLPFELKQMLSDCQCHADQSKETADVVNAVQVSL